MPIVSKGETYQSGAVLGMTFGQAISLLVILCSLPGCSFYHYAAHNACHDLSRASDARHAERQRHKLADEAWARYEPKCPRRCRAGKDFAAGFHAGYVDYLVYDGPGEPPIVPPAKYWTIAYQNPEGRDAIQAWNDGFRIGASTARDDGFRQFQVLPIGNPVQEFVGNVVLDTKHDASPVVVPTARKNESPSIPDRNATAAQPGPETNIVVPTLEPVSWRAEQPGGHK